MAVPDYFYKLTLYNSLVLNFVKIQKNMSKYFGKTWWGEHWLQSLSNIDYSNRLPRGSRYARRGAVESLDIEENIILAKVAGSRPDPYEVKISVPLFDDGIKKQFVEELTRHPEILSKLLNRKLDPRVLDISREFNLAVFPTSWEDLEMNCSCPDWAVPCKHLAAVIYKVCAEIDNNPFLVFELHGLDLLSVLGDYGIQVDRRSIEIPFFSENLGEYSGEYPDEEDSNRDTEKAYRKIEFSGLRPVSDEILALLAEDPPFYNYGGDFKKKFTTEFKKVGRRARKIAEGKVSIEEELEHFAVPDEVKISEDCQIEVILTSDYYLEVRLNEEQLALPELMQMVGKIPSRFLFDYAPTTAAMHTALYSSIHLLANGAVVPEIFRISESTYSIRWVPALLSREVQTLVEQLDNILPPELPEYEDQEGSWAGGEKRAYNLLGQLITEWVYLLSDPPVGDLFLEIFFEGGITGFGRPGETALSGGIHAWLSGFFISSGRYVPQLKVTETPEDKFHIEWLVSDRRDDAFGTQPLGRILQEEEFVKVRYDVLKSFAHLVDSIPQLNEFLRENGKRDIVLTLSDFEPFLLKSIPLIKLLGINLMLPKSMENILKPKASIIVDVAESNKSVISVDEMFRFDWRVALGDEVIDPGEFEKLMSRSTGLLKFKSNYIYADSEDLKKLGKHLSASRKPSRMQLLRSALSGEYEGARVKLTKNTEKLLEEMRTVRKVPVPDGLNAQLRPYQKRGYSWLVQNSRFGFGSILADDMGLGKTIQVIATILRFKEMGSLGKYKVLVICPTGLLSNWKSEFDKFAPQIKAEIYHGPNRAVSDEPEVVITSYGVVRSDANKLAKLKWILQVIDEAQNVKNPKAGQSKAVNSIPAKNRIALSGTPVENRLSELWSIANFCNKGLLGPPPKFKNEFSKPIELYNDFSVAEKLKRITGPFLMRRLKTDKRIISDLPDKVELNSYAQLSPDQVSLYRATLDKALADINKLDATDNRQLFHRKSLVLQLILALKQICNHPAQFLKNKETKAELSGKVLLLFEKLETIIENREKVLIFTQFREMGKLLKTFIAQKFGANPMFYHGGLSVDERQTMIERFQHNRQDRIFLLSLKAAGTGLNLTAAQHVIHFDLWWNPAVESQATDRAYRIGQKNNVMVHRFITRDTFEEKIDEIIQSKKALADMTVSSGENWIGSLSNSELNSIFSM